MAYGILDTHYSDSAVDNFTEMFNSLEAEEDERGYIHFTNIEKFYFKGITEEDKVILAKEIESKKIST
ncbi:hypothetical protein [Candidatus Enterococcus huntleyi]|uniref:hypothetical protein n=1 Tax=Candidatus Enterococcus huntleyi TaxID=1857217 RepID=UPI001F2F3601|nr:hypothetical protein [Enterococcus sp. JM4C]